MEVVKEGGKKRWREGEKEGGKKERRAKGEL